jgi:hypothetical protein
MDISAALEQEKLFSYVQVRPIFDGMFFKHLSQSISPSKSEIVLNLCRLSAAEIALLERSILPTPISPDQPTIEILPRQAFFALAKTDTSVFLQCRAADVLPTTNGLKVADFVLFTGDGDKVQEYWDKHGVSLIENDNFRDMLFGLEGRYKQANLSSLPTFLSRLDASATKVLHWQMLLLRAKLDICIGSNSTVVERNLKDSKTLL